MIQGYCNCSSNGCQCDWSSSYHNQGNSFSMLFPPMSYYHQPLDEVDYMNHSTGYSSSPVDCTLSLGTPSTRLCEDDNDRVSHDRRAKHSSKTNHHGSRNSSSSSSDGFFERRCANCDTTSTPLWRNGPNGPKSLCNACGIRFKKEKRRAAAAAAAATNNAGGATSGTNETSQQMYYSIPNNSWDHHHYSQAQEIPYYFPSVGNEFRLIEDDGRDSDNAISFLSWRRPSLVHDFIR